MSKIKEYTKGDLTVVWEAEKCIHSTKCWKGLPGVFDPKARPWVNTDGANSKEIAEQVSKCPSGALTYKMKHDSEQKNTSDTVTINVMENGPLMIKQEVKIVKADGSEEIRNKPVALCRCGSSINKPFCDGSHISAGFKG
jgi:uncharacterized Fe-S cluster protein YjdI